MFKFIFFSLCLYSSLSQAFISEIIEAKKKAEGAALTLESFTDALDEIGKIVGIENDFLAYEKELREFQRSLDKYERLGLDVRDFVEIRAYDPSSLRGQIDFFRNYLRRAKNILKNFSSLMESPETLTAREQMETNRTLRALLEDNQARELRKLRREIAREKLLLDRRKKEQEFVSKQYSYINRHSKKSGFGVFHPFQNKNEFENKKSKKFLGIF